MENNGSVSPPDAPAKDRVEFRYLKSTAFRVIHVDGAWGGVTPRGEIHMVLYNERPSIPDSMFHRLNPDGRIGDVVPEATKGDDGMVREVEVDAIMSLPAAKALVQWLGNKVQHIEKAINEAIADAEAREAELSEEVSKQ